MADETNKGVCLGAAMSNETPGEGWDVRFDTPEREALGMPPLDGANSGKSQIEPEVVTPRGKRGDDRVGGGGEASGSGSGSPDENVNKRSNPPSPRDKGPPVTQSTPLTAPDDDSPRPSPSKVVTPTAFEQNRRDALAAKQRRLDGMIGKIGSRSDIKPGPSGKDPLDPETTKVHEYASNDAFEKTETKPPPVLSESDSDVEEGWDDLLAETTPAHPRGVGTVATPRTSGINVPWHRLEPTPTPETLHAPPTEVLETKTEERLQKEPASETTNFPPSRTAKPLSKGAASFMSTLAKARRGTDGDREVLRRRLLGVGGRVGDEPESQRELHENKNNALNEAWFSDAAAAAVREREAAREGPMPSPLSPTRSLGVDDSIGEEGDTFAVGIQSPVSHVASTPRKSTATPIATPRKPLMSPAVGVGKQSPLGGVTRVAGVPSTPFHLQSPSAMGKQAAARMLIAAASPTKTSEFQNSPNRNELLTSIMFSPSPTSPRLNRHTNRVLDIADERGTPSFMPYNVMPYSPATSANATTPDAKKRNAARRIMLAAAARKASEFSKRDVTDKIPATLTAHTNPTSPVPKALPFESLISPIPAVEEEVFLPKHKTADRPVAKRGLGQALDANAETTPNAVDAIDVELKKTNANEKNNAENLEVDSVSPEQVEAVASEPVPVETTSTVPDAFEFPTPVAPSARILATDELAYETDAGYGTAMESVFFGEVVLDTVGENIQDLQELDTAKEASRRLGNDDENQVNLRAYRNAIERAAMLAIQLEENEWSREALEARVVEAERVAEEAYSKTKSSNTDQLAQLKEEVDRNGYLRRLLAKAEQRRQEARGREKEASIRLNALQNSFNQQAEDSQIKLERLEDETRGTRRRIQAEKHRSKALEHALSCANVELAEHHRHRKGASQMLGMALAAIVVLTLRIVAGGRGDLGRMATSTG